MKESDVAAEWHVSIDGSQIGPVPVEKIRSLAVSGQLKPTDHIWKEGMPDWVPASSIKGLFPQQSPTAIRPVAPPPPGRIDTPQAMPQAMPIDRPLGTAAASAPVRYSTHVIDVRSLPFTSKAGLVWSFFWRGIMITIASSVAGGLVGGCIGLVMGLAQLPIEMIQVAGGIAGIAVGCFFFYLYVQWLLTSRLGAFRLQLVREDGR
jgi:GYF domain 2